MNAVFLVNGMYLEGEEGKQIARQIHEMGFELGNHSYYHPNMRDLSYEEQYQELKNTKSLGMTWNKMATVLMKVFINQKI